MALAFVERLDHENHTDSAKHCSLPAVEDGVAKFAYTDCPTSDAITDMRVFYRTYTYATDVLSTPIDVSGAVVGGAQDPDLVQLTDGTLICVYTGGFVNSPTGIPPFVRESSDGVNWSGIQLPHTEYGRAYGIYTDGVEAYILVKERVGLGGRILWYHRRGNGWWDMVVLRTIPENEDWYFQTRPNHCAVVDGWSYCIVGTKVIGGGSSRLSAFMSVDGVAPTLIDIMTVSQSFPMQQHPIIYEGTDGILRLLWLKQTGTGPETGGLATCPSIRSKVWTKLDTPSPFNGVDVNTTGIVWSRYENNGFCLDAGNQWWLTVQQEDSAYPVTHTFKGAGDASTDFTYIGSTTITDGVEDLFWTATPQVIAFVGTNMLKVVGHYSQANDRTELWICKEAALGETSGRGDGGGGTGDPKLYPD